MCATKFGFWALVLFNIVPSKFLQGYARILVVFTLIDERGFFHGQTNVGIHVLH